APLIDIQVKHFRAPRGVAVVCASIFGLAVLGLAGFVVATAIGKISQNFPDYETQFAKLTKRVAEFPPLRLLGIDPNAPESWLSPIESSTGDFLAKAFVETKAVLSTAALVAIFMIFLLIGSKGPRVRPWPPLAELDARARPDIP